MAFAIYHAQPMKIKIRFRYNDSAQYPCAAIADITDTQSVCAVCKTWAEAEAEVIEKAKAALSAGPVPEEKEVEM